VNDWISTAEPGGGTTKDRKRRLNHKMTGHSVHQTSENPPSKSLEAVLVHSVPIPDDAILVRGYDFNVGVDYAALMNSYLHTGFQASSFGKAIFEVKRMVGLVVNS